ncbi:MAG: hypothetical protein ACR2FE_03755 [Aeromicrobium sp.]
MHADLSRYDVVPGVEQRGKPLLLVPPLAALALAFDLRRGCSVVEYFVEQGRPVYLVDYGPVKFGDRGLGIEHWVDGVLPDAIEAVSKDAGDDVHVAGWSLGGIFTMFTTAAHPELPIASATAVASPFDLHAVPILAIARPLNRAGVRIVHSTYRLAGGIPAPLTRLGFQLSAIDKYLTKPIAILTHADDREFLAQIEGVDRSWATCTPTPAGRSASCTTWSCAATSSRPARCSSADARSSLRRSTRRCSSSQG